MEEVQTNTRGKGRPPKGVRKGICVYIELSTQEKLKQLSTDLGITISELTEKAINDYLGI
jgi:hypothetical protein